MDSPILHKCSRNSSPLNPSISQPARNADSPERGHLARLHGSNGLSGQDARAPGCRHSAMRTSPSSNIGLVIT